ncbi:MAG: thiamine pyrophosphate-binding protein, partial [Burkholderiaceae bacterium]|nr:thiamine pyrophosphate-binding protein [Burkholderiaceae bacterium]
DLLEARVEPDDAGAMRGHAAEPGDAAALGHGAAFDHAAASGRPSSDLDPRALANCAETIAGAARALVIAGSSFSSARARTRLARFTAISAVPALVMESPRGVADPALGALSEVLAEADLLVLLGKPLDFTLRFGDPATIAAGASFILIDGDESRLQRSVDVATRRLALRACASPHAVLDALGPALQPGTASRARAGWADAVAAAVSFRPPNWATLDAGDSAPVHPAQLGRALQRWIDRNPRTVFVSDGGEVEQWAQASVRAGERLINGVAGAIGTAVPFAIAARAACPDAPVLAVTGDGSFGFHMAEFDTALRHALPFVAVIGNDDRWNAEYQIQLREYGAARAQGCELAKATRYERVVEALGGHGEYVRHAGELDGAIERAFASARAACVNVRIAGEAAPAVRRTAIDCAGSRRSS